MAKLIPKTAVDEKSGEKFHIIDGQPISCSGQDCEICNRAEIENFEKWLLAVPFPIPPKGKRYKKKLSRENQGKTIKEICYTCNPIPCFICRRAECKLWHKDKELEGQEKGCAYWDTGRCLKWTCKKGIIKTRFSGG